MLDARSWEYFRSRGVVGTKLCIFTDLDHLPQFLLDYSPAKCQNGEFDIIFILPWYSSDLPIDLVQLGARQLSPTSCIMGMLSCLTKTGWLYILGLEAMWYQKSRNRYNFVGTAPNQLTASSAIVALTRGIDTFDTQRTTFDRPDFSDA